MPDGFPGGFGTPEDRDPLSDPVGLRQPGGVRRRDVLAGVGAAVLADCSDQYISPGWAPSSDPTTVTRSPPRPGSTRATVQPVWGVGERDPRQRRLHHRPGPRLPHPTAAPPDRRSSHAPGTPPPSIAGQKRPQAPPAPT